MNCAPIVRGAVRLMICLGSVGSLIAAEPGAEPAAVDAPSSAAALADEQLERWIADLDSAKFTERDEATTRLKAAGPRALARVTAAAQSESREVAVRALHVLAHWMATWDKESRERAKSALEQVARGDNEAAARRATEILNPPAPVTTSRGVIGAGRIVMPIGAANGPIALPVNANVQIRVNNVQMRVQQAGGQRTIEVTENGRQVQIKESPQNGIEMSVTESNNGQPKTEKYQAKNLEELRKQHPEAARLYDTYSGGRIGGGAIQIQMQAGGGLQIQPAVPQPVPPRAVPAHPAPSGNPSK